MFVKTLITSEEIRKSIEAYRTSVTEYANLIEVSVDESAARAVSRLDSERNAAYSSCKIFAENADPTRLNQDQSTGTFTNLINTLKEIGDDKLSACGFKPWLENLESKHNEYLTAVQNRNKEIAPKVPSTRTWNVPAVWLTSSNSQKSSPSTPSTVKNLAAVTSVKKARPKKAKQSVTTNTSATSVLGNSRAMAKSPNSTRNLSHSITSTSLLGATNNEPRQYEFDFEDLASEGLQDQGTVRNCQDQRHFSRHVLPGNMDKEGFGNCTNLYECQAACPKGITVDYIAKMNREYLMATATYAEKVYGKD